MTLGTVTFWWTWAHKSLVHVSHEMIDVAYVIRLINISSLVTSFIGEESTPFYGVV